MKVEEARKGLRDKTFLLGGFRRAQVERLTLACRRAMLGEGKVNLEQLKRVGDADDYFEDDYFEDDFFEDDAVDIGASEFEDAPDDEDL